MVYEILLVDTENGNYDDVNVLTKQYFIIILFM